MSLTRTLGRIFVAVSIAIVFLLSLRMPTSSPGNELSILMEPDGTGIWGKLVSGLTAGGVKQ